MVSMSVLQVVHSTATLVPIGSLSASCAVFTRRGYLSGGSSPSDISVIEISAEMPMEAAMKGFNFI
jgi:hypothetical protein